ncbi:uncharacterized protein A4U43_C09F2410 [Asparagus officinalis]|uniref:Uncharacterized protein n=1 Tax=Asparagus officinalis TaxID=4686 RepID=A0A5P1E4P7_ASPOF|nr:uncharacterized protein A4U43_C09F2410 [Asparagus officinalis]
MASLLNTSFLPSTPKLPAAVPGAKRAPTRIHAKIRAGKKPHFVAIRRGIREKQIEGKFLPLIIPIGLDECFVSSDRAAKQN